MPTSFRLDRPRDSDPRAGAADRFAERRTSERRLVPEFDGDDRREGERRDGERRDISETEFSREAAVRIRKIIEDPAQADVLRKGKLSCPQCGGQLRARRPSGWTAKAMWDVGCRGCSRTLIHKGA